MFSVINLIITVCILCFSSLALAQTTYFKCVTPKGTTFSQFPCSDNATSHTITATEPKQTGTEINYTKQLNELERDTIISNLEAELRSNQHKLAILLREKDRADFKQQQRLNHILSADDKKRISKDIRNTQKKLDKQYKKDKALIEKRIKKLQKKIDAYQP
jgi:Domain of unknown function (DUF4124)